MGVLLTTFRHVLAAADGSRALARVRIPVQLVAGSDDPIVDLTHLRRLAEDLPRTSPSPFTTAQTTTCPSPTRREPWQP